VRLFVPHSGESPFVGESTVEQEAPILVKTLGTLRDLRGAFTTERAFLVACDECISGSARSNFFPAGRRAAHLRRPRLSSDDGAFLRTTLNELGGAGVVCQYARLWTGSLSRCGEVSALGV
jgi:hypothetical protein